MCSVANMKHIFQLYMNYKKGKTHSIDGFGSISTEKCVSDKVIMNNVCKCGLNDHVL